VVNTKKQINFGSGTIIIGKYCHRRNVIVEQMLDRFEIEFLESLVETGFSFLCKRNPRIYHAVFEIIDDRMMLMAFSLPSLPQCTPGITSVKLYLSLQGEGGRW
jgi:hypothetical protein